MSNELQNYYPLFDSNQVLTKNQLNDLFNYLDEQDRLNTRVRLTGEGIVTGLELSYNASTGTLIISEGYGITSDGYIITFNKFKVFDKYVLLDRMDPLYGLWEQEYLYELIECDSDCPCSVQIKDAPSITRLEDKIVVLYLDDSAETKICTEQDFKIGKKRKFNVRVFLCDRENQKISFASSLGEIKSPRLRNLIVVKNEKMLEEQFSNAIKDLKQRLKIHIGIVYHKYARQFNLHHWEDDIQSLKNTLSNINFETPFIQYGYDFLKDLTLAINEFSERAYNIYRQHGVNYRSFEKHLMLGKVSPIDVTEEEYFRHTFVKSPVIDPYDFKQTQILFYKIISLVNNFDKSLSKYKIKLTPSFYDDKFLSRKAIPFYYENAIEIIRYWNPEFTLSGRSSHNLSYREEEYNDSGNPLISEPFLFNVDDYNFYRIEGHIGHDYEYVVNEITHLRDENYVPFNIITLKLKMPDFSNDFNNDFDIDGGNCTYWFKDFAKNHPGMEHQAGVPRGGTFILVINDNHVEVGNEKRRVVFDFCLLHPWHADTRFVSAGYMGTFITKYLHMIKEQSKDGIYDEFPGIGAFLLMDYVD
jgi:hypothetical protein